MQKNTEIMYKDMNIDIHPNVKTVGTVYIEDLSYLVKADGQRVTTENKDLTRSVNDLSLIHI